MFRDQAALRERSDEPGVPVDESQVAEDSVAEPESRAGTIDRRDQGFAQAEQVAEANLEVRVVVRVSRIGGKIRVTVAETLCPASLIAPSAFMSTPEQNPRPGRR